MSASEHSVEQYRTDGLGAGTEFVRGEVERRGGNWWGGGERGEKQAEQ